MDWRESLCIHVTSIVVDLAGSSLIPRPTPFLLQVALTIIIRKWKCGENREGLGALEHKEGGAQLQVSLNVVERCCLQHLDVSTSSEVLQATNAGARRPEYEASG